MIKNILLTGATGFIGSHLLEKLLKESYNVIILTRSFSDTLRIKHLLIKVKKYDIDKTSLETVFKENKIDCVIHLATYYRKKHSKDDVINMIDTNIKFPSELLEQMRLNFVKYFINTGTFFEYAQKSEPINETQSRLPYDLYAATKIAFSEILKYYSNQQCITSIDLKLFAPYGPKDNEKLIVFVVKNYLGKKKFSISPGEQKWNWTFVEDIADAYIKALKYIEKMDNSYEIFNIGSDKVYSIKEIIEIIEKINGGECVVSYDKPYSQNEIFYVCCDNTKAKNLLGWIPKYSLQDGLKQTYNYYRGESNEI